MPNVRQPTDRPSNFHTLSSVMPSFASDPSQWISLEGWIAMKFQSTWMGAGIEWVVWQVMDKYWTNFWHLSNACPIFVKNLSMSNPCQSFVVGQVMDKSWTNIWHLSNVSPIFSLHSALAMKLIACPIFVKELSMSKVCSNLVPYNFFVHDQPIPLYFVQAEMS